MVTAQHSTNCRVFLSSGPYACCNPLHTYEDGSVMGSKRLCSIDEANWVRDITQDIF